jgi:uncharacterized protein (DUF2249 family)
MELDVREIPKPQRHPLIFEQFAKLAVGESFVLVNNHDPKHLREEFEVKHPGQYSWDYLSREIREFRILITKRVPGTGDTGPVEAIDGEPGEPEIVPVEITARP